MFRMMDTDNDGIISHDELKAGLPKFDSHLVESEMQMLIEAVSLFHISMRSYNLHVFYGQS